MASEYPVRPAMPAVARYLCMAFGIACVAGGLTAPRGAGDRAAIILGSLLAGGIWFLFGWHGGIPLVGTVVEWRRPDGPDAVTDLHRQGLLVMRRRRWWMWLSTFRNARYCRNCNLYLYAYKEPQPTSGGQTS